MTSYELPPDQVALLRRAHKQTRDRAAADRIKAIVLLSQGWKPVTVAEALLIDERTVREYFRTFQHKGLDGLMFRSFLGREPYLNSETQAELAQYLNDVAPATAKEVVVHVRKKYGVSYSISGMTKLLRRMNFVYKKTKSVPAKAEAEAQREFVKQYRTIRKNNPTEPILFMDGCHPIHNNVTSHAWIQKGTDKRIKANTGRQRLNINGAIDIKTHEMHVVFSKSVNAQSTIELFKQVESFYPNATRITIIADNARYYRSRLVSDFLKTSRIKILFLPPYSPNLNLIERLWRFMRTKVLNNRYYETFPMFRAACENFFGNIKRFSKELDSLLTENFQILGQAL